MNSLIPDAMAQSAGASPAGGGLTPFIMMAVFVVIFYFLLIRPQQKKQKEHQAMLSKIGEGDEVVTAGGVLGRVISVIFPTSPPEVTTSSPAASLPSIAWCSFCFFCCGRMSRK